MFLGLELTMKYETLQDRKNQSHWRAEAIDHASEGECYVVIFSGPHAQQRAEEYVAWKNEVSMQPLHLSS